MRARSPAPRRERGVTLIEALVAMAVVTVAAVGTIAVSAHQEARNGEARRITEATALAQDLVEQMAGWSYDDPRLADTNTSNNADLGDTALAFEGDNPVADHTEADLTSGGTWTGLPARTGFQRYWNVAAVGTQRRIAVIVRWPQGGGWRRVVTFTSRADMSGVTTP